MGGNGYICGMNAKELQLEYVRKMKGKIEAPLEVKNEPDMVYLKHVLAQARELMDKLDEANGMAYLQDALREYPDKLPDLINELKKPY